MTQNNKNLTLMLQNFFNKYPDIREARNKGLVNRRALAKYIIEKENLDKSGLEALVTALRRFEIGKESKPAIGIIKDIKISTKDNIAIVYLERSDEAIKNLHKAVHAANLNKNETLKFVQGSSSLALFIDDFNVKKIENIFNGKVTAIDRKISELNVGFPDNAIKTKGVISYLTSGLAINNVNIIEFLTGKPELIIYVKEHDLLKAYEAIRRLKEGSPN